MSFGGQPLFCATFTLFTLMTTATRVWVKTIAEKSGLAYHESIAQI